MTVIFGTPDFAASSPFTCSDALPGINKSAFDGTVPDYTAGSGHQVVALVQVPSAGDGLAGETLLEVKTSGSVASLALLYQNSSGGKLTLRAFNSGDASLGSVPPSYTGCNGQLLVVVMGVDTPSAGSTTYRLNVAQPGASAFTSSTDTATASALGKITKVIVNSDDFSGDQDLDATTIGHVGVQPTSTPDTGILDVLDAWSGEAAGDRFSRLCTEQGLAFRGQGQLSTSTQMGPQAQDALLSLLQDCVDADQGVLVEPRQVFGLGYRTRSSLYGQDAAITLSYPDGDLVSGLNPADDDQYTRNDVTVSRQDGSSARKVLSTGPLSIQDPPDGVGVYDVEVTLNLETDSQCSDAAGWLLNTGTVDEHRYPDIGVDLASTSLSGIFWDLQQDDLGDRFVIQDPPSWMPPDDISQITAQQTEQIGGFIYQQDRTGIPASPYNVFTVEDATLGLIDDISVIAW